LPVQQVEPAAAQTGARGLDDRQSGRDGNRSVERVPALGEYFLSGFAGERIRAGDGALVRNRGRKVVLGLGRSRGEREDQAEDAENSQSLRCFFSSISTMG